MKILSVETSCDETAVSIVQANGGLTEPHFTVLGNALFSQIELHKEYGGVFPNLAKREHAKNLIPLLEKALAESGLIVNTESQISNKISESKISEIEKILEREDGLGEKFIEFAKKYGRPEIDVISVTSGPGLEPALWVGISFALALGKLWDIPVVGANHMEGHITSVLTNGSEISNENTIRFPALALLISGGHTELVEIKGWGQYKILGQTRDDAVGEAFDKVARLLGLPYPGGPEISRLAEKAREQDMPRVAKLPRPMIHSDNLDFSFSGLKTAVLYYIRDHGEQSDAEKMDLAREFEDAVVEVLLHKTNTALEQTGAKTLIIAGGVIANKKIRESFAELAEKFSDLTLKVPTKNMATDNALMIACASYINVTLHPEVLKKQGKIVAEGNLKLSTYSNEL